MKKPSGLVLLGLLVTSGLVSQEVNPRFVGRLSAEVEKVPQTLHGAVGLGTEVSWGEVDGAILGGIALRDTVASWDWPEAWLALGESWPLFIKVGLWPDPKGPALFHSLVPTFTSGSGTEFLATAGSAPLPSPGKVSLRATGNEWSWSGEISPWRPTPLLPDPHSRWFPRKDIPTSLPVLGYPLNSVLAENEPRDEKWTEWPLRSELRWSALWGDVSAGAYRGPDPQLLLPARMRVDASVNTFDVVLVPVLDPVNAVWTTLEIPMGSGKLWAEQRWTWGRRVLVEGTDVSDSYEYFVQRTGVASIWEGLMGANVSFSGGAWGTLRFWAEGSFYRDISDPSRVIPDFTAGLVGGTSWEESRGLWRLDLMGGTPWDPQQGWVWLRASWNWMEGRTLWLGTPGFWGPPESAWGQFAGRSPWAWGVSWEQ